MQRIFRINGCQARNRATGHRPHIEALPSVATAPDRRWATDPRRVWGGRDGWLTLALVTDCQSRELSKSGKATTAASALDKTLIKRFRAWEVP